MGCAGNPYARTPAIDQIAKRGMRFASAYCASPVCSPSRGSMVTGLFPHQHGVTVNNMRIDAGLSEICLARLLAQKGYECAYAGKWHLPNGAMTKADLAQHPYRILGGPLDERVSDACAEFLGEKRDRPFFLVASYLNPHDICLWAMDRSKAYQKYPVPETPLEDCPPLLENFGLLEDEPSVLREFYLARHVEHKSFDREQLFDLEADPGEMHNLARDPKCGKILNEHRRRLATWRRETNDKTSLPHLVPAEWQQVQSEGNGPVYSRREEGQIEMGPYAGLTRLAPIEQTRLSPWPGPTYWAPTPVGDCTSLGSCLGHLTGRGQSGRSFR